jgi:AraC family transcriptional regulator
VAGTILTAPGIYRLAPVPDGRYHLMAAALPRSEDPSIHLLPGDALRVGRARGPLTVRGGRTNERMDVTLRPLEATDPPVLVSLPALLIERYAPDGPRQKAR